MRRFRLRRRSSRRIFRKGLKVHRRNRFRAMRGGIRL